MVNIHSFQQATDIIHQLQSHGYDAYFVGGSVRDFVIGRPFHDIDIATSASATVVSEIFSKTIGVALEHGTVIVRHLHQSYEVTSFRGDTLVEDLGKRDFTMNAMAMTCSGEIIDPYNGQTDIEHSVIKVVGKSEQRFVEDPLRMLRLFRFMSELGFTIDQKTFDHVKGCNNLIANVSIERIINELQKLFLGKNVDITLKYLIEADLLTYRNEFEKVKQLKTLLDDGFEFSKLKTITEIWTLLFFKLNIQDFKAVLRSWKQANKVIKEVDTMMAILPLIINEPWSSIVLYKIGEDLAKKIDRVKCMVLREDFSESTIASLYNQLPIKSRKELKINGKEIGNLIGDRKAGKTIGEFLVRLEELVVKGCVKNDKKCLFEWLRKEV